MARCCVCFLPVVLSVLTLVFLLTGCDSNDSVGMANALVDTTGVSGLDQRPPYTLFLSGTVSDTLQGNAAFGVVIDPGTGVEQFIVKMAAQNDFTGGVFVARRDLSLPRPGSYQLGDVARAPLSVPDSMFVVVYRKGLDRYFKSTGGTLSIDVATDSLIEGSLEAAMVGWITASGELQDGQEIRIRGSFSARPGFAGYVIGL